jgi:hypothetical protein
MIQSLSPSWRRVSSIQLILMRRSISRNMQGPFSILKLKSTHFLCYLLISPRDMAQKICYQYLCTIGEIERFILQKYSRDGGKAEPHRRALKMVRFSATVVRSEFVSWCRQSGGIMKPNFFPNPLSGTKINQSIQWQFCGGVS